MFGVVGVAAEPAAQPQPTILLESVRARIQRIIQNLQRNRPLRLFPAVLRTDVDARARVHQICQVRHQGDRRNGQQALLQRGGSRQRRDLGIHPVVKPLTVDGIGRPTGRGTPIR